MKTEIKKIACIGAGYVGGPTMSVIADRCPDVSVTVIDGNQDRINDWNGVGQIPVFEPGLEEVVSRASGRNLFFIHKAYGAPAIADADVVFIAVNTPTKTEGSGAGKAFDLSYVESCAKFISQHASGHTIVVEKSTMPVRAADVIKKILGENKSGATFDVISNPEFMAEGTAINDLERPDRVLIGGENPEPVEALSSLYARWVPKERIITTGLWSAELSKLASNAFLAQRVSSINAISALCEATGANVDEVSSVLGTDSRIGPKFLRASVGFGGSCFKKDVLCLVYLCEFYGVPEAAEYWMKVIEINEWQKSRFAGMVCDRVKSRGRVVAILGLAFKKNTNDFRESPAISICNQLLSSGMTLRLHDEKVDPFAFGTNLTGDGWTFYRDLAQAVSGADAILVLTEWDQYRVADWESLSKLTSEGAAIFDGRNVIDKVRARLSGFDVFTVGHGTNL